MICGDGSRHGSHALVCPDIVQFCRIGMLNCKGYGRPLRTVEKTSSRRHDLIQQSCGEASTRLSWSSPDSGFTDKAVIKWSFFIAPAAGIVTDAATAKATQSVEMESATTIVSRHSKAFSFPRFQISSFLFTIASKHGCVGVMHLVCVTHILTSVRSIPNINTATIAIIQHQSYVCHLTADPVDCPQTDQ